MSFSTIDMIFNFFFFVGAIVISAALIAKIFPYHALIDKLTDHSNLFSRHKEQKAVRSNELIYVGIGIIVLTGVVQFIVWLLSPDVV